MKYCPDIVQILSRYCQILSPLLGKVYCLLSLVVMVVADRGVVVYYYSIEWVCRKMCLVIVLFDGRCSTYDYCFVDFLHFSGVGGGSRSTCWTAGCQVE